MNIRKLLDVENDDKILSFTITSMNIPIWVFIRYDYFWYMQKHIYNISEGHLPRKKSEFMAIDKGSYIFNTLIYNPFRTSPKNILIIGAGINNVREGEVYQNKLYDDYVHVFDKSTILIESSVKGKYLKPRKDNNVLYIDLLNILSRKLSRYFEVCEKDKKEIDDFIDYFTTRVDKEAQFYLKSLRSKLLTLSISIDVDIKSFRMLLKKINPKIIIVEDAHYGYYSFLITLAKELNIVTAEFQHGYINHKHFAYNFHNNIINLVKPYLPDYFLLYGRYWGERTNTPSNKIIIGNNYLVTKYQNNNQIKKKQILVISGGTCPDLYVALGFNLKKYKALNGYQFIFRPHPSEKSATNERYSQLFTVGFILDEGNLYDSLSDAEIVISYETSTVLFEAILFTNKVFIMWSRQLEVYLEKDFPFTISYSDKELVQLIENENSIDESIKLEIWQADPLRNYEKFIKSIVPTIN